MAALNNRLTTVEDRISELEDEQQEAYRQQQTMGRDLKIALGRIRGLEDDAKRNNIRIIGVPEGQEGNPNKKATVKEIIAEKFSELDNTDIQILGA